MNSLHTRSLTDSTGNPLHSNNMLWWFPQFRKLLGFETVEEFPDVIDSWASRLHPDGSKHTLDAFIKHLNDHYGATDYDVEYRVKLKNGSCR
ncbi:TPA: PAS domain-containing protein [Yersinia enterocolitica]